MKKVLICFVAVALAGCATVHESYGPDGRKAYALNCSGTGRGWDKCLVAAGEKCGSSGYDVLDRIGESTASSVSGYNGGASTHSTERSMLVACKK